MAGRRNPNFFYKLDVHIMANSNPLDGKLVLLLGGDGMLGTHVAQELLARGARLRIASRNPKGSFNLKPLANLGQIQFTPCDVTKPQTIAPSVAGVDAVVYLVGSFDGDLDALHVSGAQATAQAAKQAGAEAFVYISAINADAQSPIAYARTKAEGETAVRGAFPTATILRPAILAAEEDHFINKFAGLIAGAPVVPILAPTAPLQPLFIDDAAKAVAEALALPARHGGQTFEIAGPQAMDVATLNHQIAAAQERKPCFVTLSDGVAGLLAALTGWLPGAPITSKQLKLLQAGSAPSGKFPGIEALGVTPQPLSLYLPRWMVRYRKNGRFGAKAKMA